MAILVFLLTLILLIVNDAIHSCVNLLNALVDHVKCTLCHSAIIPLLGFLVEVAALSMSINKVSFTIKEASFFLFTNASI